MSTERLDLYIPEPSAAANDDAFLPLRLAAAAVAGWTISNVALSAALGVEGVIPAASSDGGEASMIGGAVVVVLLLPLFAMVWAISCAAAWYVLRRDLPCIVAILVGLAWAAFGS